MISAPSADVRASNAKGALLALVIWLVVMLFLSILVLWDLLAALYMR